eukprot:TRINITY_DN12542_c0_g1_i1.p3 TRINITY_DN12542_c0_g1~~TRINITY_DN12542_c0_g1_i1.p3  ORF type:complete len:632 (+),score=66.38 TRINITY_DN12542_c0_g1_i1:4171-6066(+)
MAEHALIEVDSSDEEAYGFVFLQAPPALRRRTQMDFNRATQAAFHKAVDLNAESIDPNTCLEGLSQVDTLSDTCWECPYCKRAFPDKPALSYHIRYFHILAVGPPAKLSKLVTHERLEPKRKPLSATMAARVASRNVKRPSTEQRPARAAKLAKASRKRSSSRPPQDKRVPMIHLESHKIIAGSAAPAEKEVDEWLKRNPGFDRWQGNLPPSPVATSGASRSDAAAIGGQQQMQTSAMPSSNNDSKSRQAATIAQPFVTQHPLQVSSSVNSSQPGGGTVVSTPAISASYRAPIAMPTFRAAFIQTSSSIATPASSTMSYQPSISQQSYTQPIYSTSQSYRSPAVSQIRGASMQIQGPPVTFQPRFARPGAPQAPLANSMTTTFASPMRPMSFRHQAPPHMMQPAPWRPKSSTQQMSTSIHASVTPSRVVPSAQWQTTANHNRMPQQASTGNGNHSSASMFHTPPPTTSLSSAGLPAGSTQFREPSRTAPAVSSKCPYPGCDGSGNVNPRWSNHNSLRECPLVARASHEYMPGHEVEVHLGRKWVPCKVVENDGDKLLKVSRDGTAPFVTSVKDVRRPARRDRFKNSAAFTPSDNSDRPYRCIVADCNACYKGPSGLFYHMKSIHPNVDYNK